MASNGTDFKLNIIANLKDLKNFKREMDKIAKDQKRDFDKRIKLESKHHKAKRRELEYEKRLAVGITKDQKKHAADLYKVQKKGRSEEWAHSRKLLREQKRQQTEVTRWRRKEERALSRSPMRSAAGGAFRTGAGVAVGLTGMLISGAVSSYEKHLQVQRARGGLIGMAPGPTVINSLRRGKGGGAWGSALGYNAAESAQQAALMGRSTGVTGPRELQQLMRSTGLQAGEASQYFGQVRQAGYGFAGGQKAGESAGARQMKNILSAAVYTGLERARFPEFAEGVFKVVEQQGALRTGQISPTDVAKILATFGKTGMEGMKGARGVAVAQKLQAAFTKPGGGEWGQSFFQMAMGFGKPGGGTSYYQAEKMRERGLTSDNAERLLKEVISQFGGGEEGALAMRELTGVGLEQAEALLQLGKDGDFSKEKLAQIDDILDQSKSLEQQAVDHMKGIGGTLKRLAGRFDTFASIGADLADEIEAVQDAQLALFKGILKALESIKGILSDIRTWVGEFTGKGTTPVSDAAKGELSTKRGELAQAVLSNPYSAKSLLEKRQIELAYMSDVTKTSALRDIGPLEALTGGGKRRAKARGVHSATTDEQNKVTALFMLRRRMMARREKLKQLGIPLDVSGVGAVESEVALGEDTSKIRGGVSAKEELAATRQLLKRAREQASGRSDSDKIIKAINEAERNINVITQPNFKVNVPADARSNKARTEAVNQD